MPNPGGCGRPANSIYIFCILLKSYQFDNFFTSCSNPCSRYYYPILRALPRALPIDNLFLWSSQRCWH